MYASEFLNSSKFPGTPTTYYAWKWACP
jgi:hypothetical protein